MRPTRAQPRSRRGTVKLRDDRRWGAAARGCEAGLPALYEYGAKVLINQVVLSRNLTSRASHVRTLVNRGYPNHVRIVRIWWTIARHDGWIPRVDRVRLFEGHAGTDRRTNLQASLVAAFTYATGRHRAVAGHLDWHRGHVPGVSLLVRAVRTYTIQTGVVGSCEKGRHNGVDWSKGRLIRWPRLRRRWARSVGGGRRCAVIGTASPDAEWNS